MHSNNSAANQPPSLPNEELEISVSVVVYSLLSISIIVGNSLVIAAYRYNPRLQTLTNTFLAWLALSDLLVGLVAVPLWIYISSCHQFRSCNYGNDLSIFYGTVDVFTGCTSVLQLVAISLERFLAITRPFSHRTYSIHMYRGMITGAWVSSFVLAGLYPLQIIYNWRNAYSVAIATASYILPTTVIIAVYVAIFKSVKNSSIRCIHPITTNASLRKRQQNETRTAVTIGFITGLFLVAWTPFCVLNLVAQFCPTCLPAMPKVLRLVRFVKWMHYSNSVVNPCVYTYRNKEMRKTFMRLLQACLCCRKNNLAELTSSTRTQGLGRSPALRSVNLPYGGVEGASNKGSKNDSSGGGPRVPLKGTLL